MKYLSASVAIATTLTVASSLQPSHANDCINYWTNPSTGQQECLGEQLQITKPPVAPSVRPRSSSPTTPSRTNTSDPEFDIAQLSTPETMMVGFLKAFEKSNPDSSKAGLANALKDCTPYSNSLSETYRLVPQGMTIARSLVGDRYGNCIVTVGITAPELNGEEVAARCQFSPTNLSYLANELANAEFHTSSRDNRATLYGVDIKRSNAIFKEECQAIPSFTAETPNI